MYSILYEGPKGSPLGFLTLWVVFLKENIETKLAFSDFQLHKCILFLKISAETT